MKANNAVSFVLLTIVALLISVESQSVHGQNVGNTTRVSVASDKTEANGGSTRAVLSANGRYIAFSSFATNLVSNDTNNREDIFIHDRQTGATDRVSVASDGTQADLSSEYLSMSTDGRYVAFNSFATNLVSNDTNGLLDIFVHDRQTGETTRVSVASNGTQANNESRWNSVSADGRYIAFSSLASNLVNNDTNASWDVFVHDTQTAETTRVSIASDGSQANGVSIFDTFSSMSADGRYVAFRSDASNLVMNDTNSGWDIFVHDRQTAETTRVSVTSDGTQANNSHGVPLSGQLSISADGRYVAFNSYATNLVGNDTNGAVDIFVHDQQTAETTRLSVASDGTQANQASSWSSISADGRYIAFISFATNLVSNDTNGFIDIFIHDRQTAETTRLSVASDGTQANNPSTLPSISADGNHIAFVSLASNLIDNDTNNAWDIFVHDRLGNEPVSTSTISGQVIDSYEAPLPGVTISAGFFGSDITDENGEYTITDLIPKTYTLTPLLDNYAFSPPTQIVTVPPDKMVYFMALPNAESASISGMVMDNSNVPLPDVTISAGFFGSDVTDANGEYIITDLIPRTYTLTPVHDNYIFLPPTRDVALPQDVGKQNFTAIKKINGQELAQKFSPYFHLHKDEIYLPMSVDLALEEAESIVNQDDLSQKASQPITTDTLASDEWRERENSYVDFKGKGTKNIEDYYKAKIQSRVVPTVYARVFEHDSGQKVIQYWIYYYANPWKNYHEGDWEMVQVVLDNDANAITAAYSQHSKKKFGIEFTEGGTKKLWEYVRKDGNHPLVYPGKGSHASYFVPYDHLVFGVNVDTPRPSTGNIIKPEVKFLPVLDNEDSWLYYKGRWGEVTSALFGFKNGPRGPISQDPIEKWSDPVAWLDLIPWDEFAKHHLMKYRFWALPPLDVRVFNSDTGERIGWFGDTLYREIESGEYIDNKIANRRTVIIHDSSPLDWTLNLFISLRSPDNVKGSSLYSNVEAVIEYPQEDGTLARITYTIPIEGWTTDTHAQVVLEPNSDYILEVDLDNDGSIDVEVNPRIEILNVSERSVYLPLISR